MVETPNNGGYKIRPIRPEDNPAVAQIIRQVMTEFGAVGCGFSIEDDEVDSMFEAYPALTVFSALETRFMPQYALIRASSCAEIVSSNFDASLLDRLKP